MGDSERQLSMAVSGNPDTGVIYARVLKLLGVRERSVHELRERLLQEGFEDEAIEEALVRAQACGALDDRRFAQAYIRGKLHVRWGRERIERELMSYGVDVQTLSGYPSEFFFTNDDDDDVEVQRAVQELERLRSTAKDQHEARWRRLRSKGYSAAVIQAAVRQVERVEE